MQEITNKDKLRELDRFLVESQELERLTSRLNRFNILNVLKISEFEIRHSNILGWLLDPNENHKLGDRFLRRFLSSAVHDVESLDVDVRASSVELMDFYDIEVRREYRNIDVLIIDRTNQLVTLIENKIKSKESKGQLEKYNQIVEEEFSHFKKLRILLTINKDEPSDAARKNGFFPFSHLEILKVLEQLIEGHRNNIPSEQFIFINHYLDTLRILTMDDKEVVDLCRKIYKKHKVAIDLISEYAVTNNFNDVAFEVVKKQVPNCKLAKAWSSIYFLPPEVDALLPEYGGENYSAFLRKTPMSFWFAKVRDKDKCILGIEVGDFPDSDKRKDFLNKLVDLGFDIKSQSFRDESRISRVKSYTEKFDDPSGDEESIEKCFLSLLKKSKSDIQKIMELLKSLNDSKSYWE